MEHASLYLFLAGVFGLVMTWGVGANDLANVMATALGSKAITVRQAMVVAVVFEFAGALIGGEHVTETMRTGIINTALISPNILIYGMLAVLLASMTWINFASFLGMPVSITNAIVGAVVGFGTVVLGVSAIHWNLVLSIAMSWVISPAIALVLAYLLFFSIQSLIFVQRYPVKQAKRYLPFYLFLVGLTLSNMMILKGLKHFMIVLALWQKVLITLSFSASIVFIGWYLMHRFPVRSDSKRHERFAYIEKTFAVLMGFTACAMVFAHGSNDVAVAVGPITLIIKMLQDAKELPTGNFIGLVTFLGCSGVLLGLLMYGRKVIETVGSGITALTPSRAFAATLAAASTVVMSTSAGIPVSATQTLVGAVLGVGLARGIGALNMVVIRNIFSSWIVTLPATSVLSIVFYHGFYAVFH